jgi:hypothetical protein
MIGLPAFVDSVCVGRIGLSPIQRNLLRLPESPERQSQMPTFMYKVDGVMLCLSA